LNPPLVSILIPIYNEAPYIQQCLEAILAQSYPSHKIEILIADGMSNDGTIEIIQKIMEKNPDIHLFSYEDKIVAKMLNKLMIKASGEILIRVDGHCVIDNNYVKNCVLHLFNNQVDGVGGSIKSVGKDKISKVIALAVSSTFGVGGSSFRTEHGITKLADTIPFPAYTRNIIDLVGLYDEELVRNQDDEYNYRIREAGGKLLLASDVQSEYFGRKSLKKLWQQFFQYGFYKVRVLQKHPRQMRIRQFVPPLFVFSIFSAVILSFFTSWGWITLYSILGIYFLVNLATTVLIMAREGWHFLGLLPLTFLTIHFAYGLGFLAGLFKFWNRWKK